MKAYIHYKHTPSGPGRVLITGVVCALNPPTKPSLSFPFCIYSIQSRSVSFPEKGTGFLI